MLASPAVQSAITEIFMFLLALVATPLDDGDSIRVDRVGAQGVEQNAVIEKTDEGFALVRVRGEEKRAVGTFRPGKEDGHFDLVVDDKVSESFDLNTLLGEVEPGKLASLDAEYIAIDGGGTVRLQRSGELLYLAATNMRTTFVVRKQ